MIGDFNLTFEGEDDYDFERTYIATSTKKILKT